MKDNMRSLLLVPGDSEKKLESALSSGADTLILDLKNRVSDSQKSTAREIMSTFLQTYHKRLPQIFVRINDLDSQYWHDDLTVALKPCLSGIVLPNSNSGADVTQLSARLNVLEANAGLSEGITKIIAIATETAIGTLSMKSYHHCSPRLIALSWEAENLAMAVGAQITHEETGDYTNLFRLARSLTLLGASAAGIPAIDTIYVNLKDEVGFKKECLAAKRDGFTAKFAIDPTQVKTINTIFL